MERTHVVVHHSLTSDGLTVSWPAIREYHTQVNGWRDIGYHYGVELVGFGPGNKGSYEVLVGRPETAHAAACPQGGMNQRAIHVCCIGNFNALPPTDEMLDVLARRCVHPVMVRYGIPVEHITGHRDWNPSKSCPGDQFDLARLRKRVA